ncbi:hypothetical protein AVEN_36576-1 [Araneus ventricosus]|uniref:Uncharacterized protein n=1 Tax=Araneus ventricosus TaxID=182803 RepID=A0A4Y2VN00_ARAVE|nr:hypothetical protein AVEN_3303-1 [Araneus ventricosus]GBO26675.1 hypothetical protein AVEN_36576-1 [Araneus ventricosus]
MVHNSIFLQPTLSPKQAHFYEWPKRMMSVFRRPDLRSQRAKSIFHRQENRALARFSSSKISPLHPRSSLFNPHLLPTGGAVKSLSTNPRQFCRWSLFQWAIIGSLPFRYFSCRKRFLRLEINDPIYHFH